MDLTTAKLSFNVLLIVQVFLLFFIAVTTFTSSETLTKNSTSLYGLVKPVDKARVLQLFIGPLNLIGLIFSSVPNSTQLILLLMYIPVRWTLAAYLVAACTASKPLLYSGGLLLEIMIEVSLGLFIWRLWELRRNTQQTEAQQNPQKIPPTNFDQVSISVFESALSPIPSYLEAIRQTPENSNLNSNTTLSKH